MKLCGREKKCSVTHSLLVMWWNYHETSYQRKLQFFSLSIHHRKHVYWGCLSWRKVRYYHSHPISHNNICLYVTLLQKGNPSHKLLKMGQQLLRMPFKQREAMSHKLLLCNEVWSVWKRETIGITHKLLVKRWESRKRKERCTYSLSVMWWDVLKLSLKNTYILRVMVLGDTIWHRQQIQCYSHPVAPEMMWKDSLVNIAHILLVINKMWGDCLRKRYNVTHILFIMEWNEIRLPGKYEHYLHSVGQGLTHVRLYGNEINGISLTYCWVWDEKFACMARKVCLTFC